MSARPARADYVGGMSRPAAAPVVSIRPPKGWAALELRELAGSHELLYFLVLRNLKLRYKQTLLGAAWAIAGRRIVASATSSTAAGRPAST